MNKEAGRVQTGPVLTEINDYFENKEYRVRAFSEAGKNLQTQAERAAAAAQAAAAAAQASAAQAELEATPSPSQSAPAAYTWPLLVVEFKAGRTDFFYASDDLERPLKKGDIVIVEADRGKDLGKVVEDNIQSVQELQYYQRRLAEILPELHSSNKTVVPKRIYRTAQPSEITTLFAKSQDEAKAMSVCQTKIRQKNLPMEVVDSEYQWDRRKLTFYFVADRRIDFRELVRELFKIYKTRIWM
jgi:cell fate regulator YaaT (PSP1 superfamily)